MDAHAFHVHRNSNRLGTQSIGLGSQATRMVGNMESMGIHVDIRIYVNVVRGPIGIIGGFLTKEQEAFCLEMTLKNQALSSENYTTIADELKRVKRAFSLGKPGPHS